MTAKIFDFSAHHCPVSAADMRAGLGALLDYPLPTWAGICPETIRGLARMRVEVARLSCAHLHMYALIQVGPVLAARVAREYEPIRLELLRMFPEQAHRLQADTWLEAPPL